MNDFKLNFLQFVFSTAIILICCDAIESFEYFTTKPKFLPSCEINKPCFTKCATDATQKLVNQLVAGGIPEIKDDVGSIEPLRIKHVGFELDIVAATVSANITNIVAKGLSKLEIKKSKVCKKDFSWETEMFMPLFRLEFVYEVKGQLLGIDMESISNIIIEMENVDLKMRTKTKLIQKGGFTFFDVEDVGISLTPTRVRSNVEDFFSTDIPADEDQNNANHDLESATFDEIMLPLIIENLEDVLIGILKKTFSAIPAKFFISDIP